MKYIDFVFIYMVRLKNKKVLLEILQKREAYNFCFYFVSQYNIGHFGNGTVMKADKGC